MAQRNTCRHGGVSLSAGRRSTRAARLGVSTAAVVALGFALSSCAQLAAPAVIAEGRSFTEQDVIDELDSQGGAQKLPNLDAYPTQAMASGVNDIVYREILLPKMADELDVEVDGRQTDDILGQLDENPQFGKLPANRRRLLAEQIALTQAVGTALLKREPAAKQLIADYAANPGKYVNFCTKAILTQPEAEAASAAAELKAGADFKAVLDKYSQDPQLLQSGGDIGCRAPAQYDQLIEGLGAQVQALSPGGSTGVIAIPGGGGFVVIALASTQPQTEDEALVAAGMNPDEAIQSHVKNVAKATAVDVNPRYGTWEENFDGYQVTPPVAPKTTGIDVPSDGQMPMGGMPPAMTPGQEGPQP